MAATKATLSSILLTLSMTAMGTPQIALADSSRTVLAQNHAGQTDTDGILSPGERRNPNIDYDRAQRRGEWSGDSRFNNPDNDDAASDARAQYNWDRGDRPYGRSYDDRYSDHDGFDPHDRYNQNRDDSSRWWRFWRW